MKCPECSHDIKLKGRETYVSCPECLTRVNAHTKKEVVKLPSSFHHFDSGVVTVSEFVVDEVQPNIADMSFATHKCLLCGTLTSELHGTKGAVLGESTLIKQQTLLSYLNHCKEVGKDVEVVSDNLGDIITRKIKIPAYKSGYVCSSKSCLDTFNQMCATRDPQFHLPQGKLMFDPVKELIHSSDDSVMGTLRHTTKDEVVECELDEVHEFEQEGIVIKELGIQFHRVEDIAEVSPQERASKHNKVAKLKKDTRSVNPRPSKRVRDMRKMVKG
jgi:hypothetical protein